MFAFNYVNYIQNYSVPLLTLVLANCHSDPPFLSFGLTTTVTFQHQNKRSIFMQELLSWSIEKITMYHVTEIAKGVKQVKKMGINFVRK